MIVLSVACSRCHHGWTQEPPEVGLSCPRCGSPLRIVDRHLEIPLRGAA